MIITIILDIIEIGMIIIIEVTIQLTAQLS